MRNEKLDEEELLMKNNRSCPGHSKASQVIAAVLRGLDAPSSVTNTGSFFSSASTMSQEIQVERRFPSTVLNKDTSTRGIISRTARIVLRLLCFDAPLMLIFSTYIFIIWVHRVHDLYLKPQLDALDWIKAREESESTYYQRYCLDTDMSTEQGSDLFLDKNSSAQDAYQHQLKHGFTVFPDVLSEKTAADLRNFVVDQNQQLREEDAIYVINNENRWSFGLGTEEPTVVRAMEELASNTRLAAAMENIVGKNAALIEMTAITSGYGAIDQWWHDDVVPDSSAIQFARSFSPSYSIFIQLQNTTKEMGATSACPGTYMCSSGEMESFCQEKGFQLVDKSGFWKTGDALLMNQNSWHRGAAHTDPNAIDRVMLILTVAPRPRNQAESRQMSRGITFSLRWDMWGHTWNDLAKASTVMQPSWATLRALGVYKPKDTDWGIDYITGSSMRMSGKGLGFREDDLVEFLERGGFKFLPQFLHGDCHDDELWYDFLVRTMHKCKKFSGQINKVALTFYLMITLLVSSLIGGRRTDSGSRKRYLVMFGGALLRLVITHSSIYLLLLAANHRVDNSDWAADIRAGHRYTIPTIDVEMENEYFGLTTKPHQNDVLVDSLYSSPFLGMYNDYIGNHPGNKILKSVLSDQVKFYTSYAGFPEEFIEAIPHYIATIVKNQQGRFLYQSHDGTWMIMSDTNAFNYIERQLKVESNHNLRHLVREVEFIISECKFGKLRDTKLANQHNLPYWKRFKKYILGEKSNLNGFRRDLIGEVPSVMRPKRSVRAENYMSLTKRSDSPALMRIFSIPVIPKRFKIARVIPKGGYPGEPWDRAWLTEGNIIEGLYTDEDGARYWYKGIIRSVSPSGVYEVNYVDGDSNLQKIKNIRRYVPYYENEVIEVYFEGEWFRAKVLSMNSDDTYNVVELDEPPWNVPQSEMRRIL